MRRFLLFLGSLGVGLFTVLFVPAIAFSGDFSVIMSALVAWVVVLVFGVALSAPFFVDPPDHKGPWSFSLPLVLMIPLLVVRALSWIGWMILRGVWWIINRFWDPRPVHPPVPVLPQQVGPTGYGPAPAVPPGYGAAGGYGASAGGFGGPGYGQPQPAPTGTIPASWQNDPTGRFMKRYWDGQQWTEHVANGSVTAIDPL